MDFSDAFGVSKEMLELAERAEKDVSPRFAELDRVSEANTAKVLDAFRKHRVSAPMFAGTNGYGYGDLGRDTLDEVYADVFRAEAALVRLGFVNGTHAIASALFAAVKPGDVLLAATGLPYDTLQSAIGLTGGHPGSLRWYGVGYAQADLTPEGKPDLAAIRAAASDPRVTAVEVQRSRGYAARPALSVSEIGDICGAVHAVNPGAAVIVDNCYGEFAETSEPIEAGRIWRRARSSRTPAAVLRRPEATSPGAGIWWTPRPCVSRCRGSAASAAVRPREAGFSIRAFSWRRIRWPRRSARRSSARGSWNSWATRPLPRGTSAART